MAKKPKSQPLHFVRNLNSLAKWKGKVARTEFEIVADVPVAGELRYGPYIVTPWEITNKPTGMPRKLCLRIRTQAKTLRSGRYSFQKQLAEGPYHGGWISDEIVTLGSLLLRRRLVLGSVVRIGDRPLMDTRNRAAVAPALFGPGNVASLAASLDLLQRLKTTHHLRFFLAARLYHQAIQSIEADPEFAYLLLVSAIETLSEGTRVSLRSVHEVDGKLAKLLAKIPNAALRLAIERQILARERSIKRRFVKFLLNHVDDRFWADPSRPPTGLLRIEPEALEGHLARVYDQRSRTLHLGERFPRHALGSPGQHNAEVDSSVED